MPWQCSCRLSSFVFILQMAVRPRGLQRGRTVEPVAVIPWWSRRRFVPFKALKASSETLTPDSTQHVFTRSCDCRSCSEHNPNSWLTVLLGSLPCGRRWYLGLLKENESPEKMAFWQDSSGKWKCQFNHVLKGHIFFFSTCGVWLRGCFTYAVTTFGKIWGGKPTQVV